MLEYLDGIEAKGGTDLAAGLKQFTIRNPSRGMKVVISDFLDKQGFSSALKWMMRGGDEVVVIQVLSPQEVKPTIVGDLSLEDCEDGQVTEVSITAGLLRKYETSLKSLVGGLREYCRTRGLAYFFVPTSAPLEQVILTAMRRTRILK